MKYEHIEKNRLRFGIQKMCRALHVSSSGYYRWRKSGDSKRDIENRKLLWQIRLIHKKHKQRYGSPRITDELQDNGYNLSENRIARLMSKNGIAAKTKRKFKVTTNSKHNLPIADNIVNGNFSASALNCLWTSDITYIWTSEGWLYLCAVLDVFNRQIVGWSMDNRMTQDLVINALQQAVWRRKPGSGCIFHSDRGSQYAGHKFRKLLSKHKFIQSMSGKGNCYDNAIMETFFHTLKTELIYFESYQTRREAKKSVFEYIEMYYNRIRKHSALNYKSPLDFERLAGVA